MKINKPLIASYVRSALAAALAVYLADQNITIKEIIAAAISAVLPPLIRWLNPNDKSFGRTTK